MYNYEQEEYFLEKRNRKTELIFVAAKAAKATVKKAKELIETELKNDI